MALFPRDPSDAVRAAVAMQEELRRTNEGAGDRVPLATGVGIHVGRVMMGTIFSALSSGGVRYLVVGGVAVVLHGHTRFTSDVDLVVALDEPNVRRAIEELRDGG